MEKQETANGDRKEVSILIHDTAVLYTHDSGSVIAAASRTVLGVAQGRSAGAQYAVPTTDLGRREAEAPPAPPVTAGPLNRQQDVEEEEDEQACLKVCLFFSGFVLLIGVALFLPLLLASKDSPQ
jgi:hypothetical protein